MNKTDRQHLALLAAWVVDNFDESDWRKLGLRTGFQDEIDNHPRLLRSLGWGDEDYSGHAHQMIAKICEADSENVAFIEEYIEGDETAVFEHSAQRFEKGERLGVGGYGEVFRERDKLLGLDFARKELRPSPFVTDRVIERFTREAQMLFRLNHPHIVGVHHVGRVGRIAYIRMELFDGHRLDEIGQQSPEAAVDLIERIAEAVEHAHSRGVIHRDLKPSNVLVSGADVRVIDFGLGAFIEAELDSQLTGSSQSIAGGPYSAPELRDDPRKRDPRSDVFSLGALWYRLLTSRAPSGSDLSTLLSEVGDVPDRHRDLILRSLAASVDSRPQSVAKFVEELDVEAPPRTALPRANELSPSESLCMMGFAILKPTSGDGGAADQIVDVAASIGLEDPLELGLAFGSLEDRSFIEMRNVSGNRWWALTNIGKNWLRNNSAVLLQLQEERREEIPF